MLASHYQVNRPCERAAAVKRNGTKHNIKMIRHLFWC